MCICIYVYTRGVLSISIDGGVQRLQGKQSCSAGALAEKNNINSCQVFGHNFCAEICSEILR